MFYDFQLLGLKKKKDPSWLENSMSFPEGTCSMEPGSYAGCRAAGSQSKVGRAGGEQDDRRPTVAPAASLLPLCCLPPSSDYLDPHRGVTRRHMLVLSLVCSKKLLTGKGRIGRCGHHLQQTWQRWNQGPIFPATLFTSRDVLRTTPPTTSNSPASSWPPASPASSWPKESGVGGS